jgi:muconolactone delta-isomerase
MLFMLRAYISKPANVSNKEFYSVWLKEAEAAMGAYKAGVIKGIGKVAGRPEVLAVMDVDSHDTLDHAVLDLPIWKTGNSHIVTTLEWTALRPYENWAEDLKKLSQG